MHGGSVDNPSTVQTQPQRENILLREPSYPSKPEDRKEGDGTPPAGLRCPDRDGEVDRTGPVLGPLQKTIESFHEALAHE